MDRRHAGCFRHCFVFAACLLVGPAATAAPPLAAAPRSVDVHLGDYRFVPDSITVKSGETVQLNLTDTDKLTPHNFTLKAEGAGLDVDVDVSAGKTETVVITPLAPGRYTFYCNKKLPFLKSHRERGMQGTLVVTPAGSE